MLKLDTSPANQTPPYGRETVTLGDATFVLLTRQPTFAEVTTDFGLKALSWQSEGQSPESAEAAVAAARIRSVVTDWEGVVDQDGHPVPFSLDLLESLCAKYPPLFLRVLRIANERFSTLPGDATKNSEPLPSAPPAAATATATPEAKESSTSTSALSVSDASASPPD